MGHHLNLCSRRSEADNPRGQNFDVNRNLLSLWSFATSFKKISLKSFIQFFSWLYTCIYPLGRGWQPLWGRNFDVVTAFICCKFQKNLFEVWFYKNKSWFYTCIYPWGRGRQPPGDKVFMSTEMSCHFIHLLQVSKKCLWILILYIFFHDLIHTYSPGAEADRGHNFEVNRKALSLYKFIASFKEISLKSDFCTLFFLWFYTCI